MGTAGVILVEDITCGGIANISEDTVSSKTKNFSLTRPYLIWYR